MTLTTIPRIVSQGEELDLSPEKFGWLRDSNDIVHDEEALRERMEEDGYIFLPGHLDREQVLQARAEVLRRLEDAGCIDCNHPLNEAIPAANGPKHHPNLWKGNEPLHRVLYSGHMVEFYERLLGEEVRHFDYTWVRAVPPGQGTGPHCDHVYMGRGTDRLFTSWTPLGDIPLELGGLMILEKTHLNERLRENYCRKDVDAFCSNRRPQNFADMGGGGNIRAGGGLSFRPAKLRDRLGGRWLTAEFRAGDLLAFNTFIVHASLDNQSNCFRLSCDSRYQRASEPADERWIGPDPIAHGPNAKRGMIC